MTGTGWVPRVVDELMLSDVNDLFSYWEKMPPSHVSLARLVEAANGLLGSSSTINGPAAPTVGDVMSSTQQGNVADLLGMFPVEGKGV